FGHRLPVTEPREKPQLGRREVDRGGVRKALVELPAMLPAGEQRQGALQLALSVVSSRAVETVSDVWGLRGLLQRNLGQEQAQDGRSRCDPGRREEHWVQRGGDGGDVDVMDRRRQPSDQARARGDGCVCAGGELPREIARELVREDRAEDGNAD